MTSAELKLDGCTPEPLMNYLKALGILRLISEDAEHGDPSARGAWRDGLFVLQTRLEKDDLTQFFLNHYRPTPILVPWSGNDFFAVRKCFTAGPFGSTPTASAIVEAFLTTSSPRLLVYREAIHAVYKAMDLSNVRKKEDIEGKAKERVKAAFIQQMRNIAPAAFIEWIDVAMTLTSEKATFSSMLGSGGGSDGNTHFSDNFMQNLWDSLPEFEPQRGYELEFTSTTWEGMVAPSVIPGELVVVSDAKKHVVTASIPKHKLVEQILKANPIFASRKAELDKKVDAGRRVERLPDDALHSAIFGSRTTALAAQRTSSLFDSGAVGGPNAGQGFERGSFTNPWNFVLGFEGALAFVGSLSRKIGTSRRLGSAFPFQFQVTATGRDSASDKEQAGRELWMPLWKQPATFREIRQLLSEGRAELRSGTVSRGVDMARAVVSLGVDRGITSFNRFAVVRGRVGGDNYNTAVHLGHFDVHPEEHVDLIREIDQWLRKIRKGVASKSSDERLPSRLSAVLRRVDGAILDLCRYGKNRWMPIVTALGCLEQHLAVLHDKSHGENAPPPLSGLSTQWLRAACDGSTEEQLAEIDLALALASMDDLSGKIGALRANLEPVCLNKGRWAWTASVKDDAQRPKHVVWNNADLSANLTAVLKRRVMDGARAGCEDLPIGSHRPASLAAISRFLAGKVDDQRVEELLWGMTAIDHRQRYPDLPHIQVSSPPIPRAYALLKLLFLHRPIRMQIDEHGQLVAAFARHGEEALRIQTESEVLPLLCAGRLREACGLAMRRLRASGLVPLPHRRSGGFARDSDWEDQSGIDGHRLAAALLFPIGSYTLTQLVRLITRPSSEMATNP